MTVAEIDIWRNAQTLIAHHGDRAEAVAEERTTSLEKAGAVEGAATFRRIRAAIAELRLKEPGGRTVQ